MAIGRRLAVGLAWMFAGNWTEQATNFVVFVVLARLLGAEAFGLAAMATVSILFAEYLVRETITETIIQLENVEERTSRRAVLPAGSSLPRHRCPAHRAGRSDRRSVFRTARRRLSGLGHAVSTFLGLLRRAGRLSEEKSRVPGLAVRATLGVLAGGVVGISMATMDLGAWSLIAQRVTQVSVISALAWVAHPWRPGLRARPAALSRCIEFQRQNGGSAGCGGRLPQCAYGRHRFVSRAARSRSIHARLASRRDIVPSADDADTIRRAAGPSRTCTGGGSTLASCYRTS